MANKIKIKTSCFCPYCEQDITLTVEASNYTMREIVLCDPEIGGCDEHFVLQIDPVIVSTSSLKIGR